MKLLSLFLIAAMVLVAGCAFLKSDAPTARLTVQYATLKVIGDDAGKRDRVIAIAEDALTRLDSTPEATVTAIISGVREQVPWAKLDEADKLLVDVLLAELEVQLTDRLGGGVLNEEARLAAATVAKWVIAAAKMA